MTRRIDRTTVAILAGLIVASAAWAHLVSATARLQQLKLLRAQEHALRAAPARPPHALEALRDRTAQADARLPHTDDPSQTLQTILHHLAALAISERSWTVSPTRAVAGLRQVSIDLSMSCSFDALTRVLDALDRTERIVRIESVSVRRDPHRDGMTRSVVRLALFSHPEEAAP